MAASAAAGHSGLEPESRNLNWIPACAGMTYKGAGMTYKDAGMTYKDAGMTISKPHCAFNRSNINKSPGYFRELLLPLRKLVLRGASLLRRVASGSAWLRLLSGWMYL